MYSQRILIILWAISCGGLLIADPGHSNLTASAVTRISLTINPQVVVDRFHGTSTEPNAELDLAHNDALCLRTNGVTNYTVTSSGREDVALRELSDTAGVCPDTASAAYALNLPADTMHNADFGNELYLIVAAE